MYVRENMRKKVNVYVSILHSLPPNVYQSLKSICDYVLLPATPPDQGKCRVGSVRRILKSIKVEILVNGGR